MEKNRANEEARPYVDAIRGAIRRKVRIVEGVIKAFAGRLVLTGFDGFGKRSV